MCVDKVAVFSRRCTTCLLFPSKLGSRVQLTRERAPNHTQAKNSTAHLYFKSSQHESHSQSTMTIKIEREALQCITNDTSECILPSLEEQPVDRLPELSFNKGLDYPELDLTECDDSSVSSYSFTSSTAERTVSWATPLVVEVRTRPRTKAMDVRQLFYSYEETQR